MGACPAPSRSAMRGKGTGSVCAAFRLFDYSSRSMGSELMSSTVVLMVLME